MNPVAVPGVTSRRRSRVKLLQCRGSERLFDAMLQLAKLQDTNISGVIRLAVLGHIEATDVPEDLAVVIRDEITRKPLAREPFTALQRFRRKLATTAAGEVEA